MTRAFGGSLLAASLTLMVLPAMPAAAAPLPQDTTTTADHGLGLDTSAIPAAPAKPQRHGTMGGASIQAAPAEADLSRFALPAGNQGRRNSCVAWATGYTGYGVIMNRQGVQGGPMAPMYTYAQIVRGNDVGTWAGAALQLQTEQGIDTREHYGPGDYDVSTQPTAAERENAAQYKLTGYERLPVQGEAAKEAIKEAVAEGHPVPVGMAIHQSFNDMDAQSAMDYSYRPGGWPVGNHETTIVGYNDRGVKLMNSWGDGWGNKGAYTVSWDVLVNSGILHEAHAMGDVAGHPSPEPTTDPTAEPTEQPTTDPTEQPTTDPTEQPTAEPTEQPTTDPTEQPTTDPTEQPTTDPTAEPTVEPTPAPCPEDNKKHWWDWFDWFLSLW